ncbi:hypothetical protein Back11_39220 [Paenibacillus baekrokdamisoli]|uniref:Uncharacterized protein n=1 Tax=Paenibacillus baekrokdamisoli TaxID=1712516 RepID=A0A3G9IUU2_9BACL|nr:class I SAM-dependent methyltransferase [Paenibacillus baekrokdamisoli]MBB3068378.1 SAM-dependent methyltransferase [Paenibacillus baekrokdamisoli]BBH22577.1 hypothetical protein Back11_39220 [Paenibacillus baekrokdamisoli]
MRIDDQFLTHQFNNKNIVNDYYEAVSLVGLWTSECMLIQKYFDKSGDILDIGCGTGRTTFSLFKMGYKNLIGVDLSEEMITRANEINNFHNYSIPFHTGNATKLEYDDESFDFSLFSFNGLMHIPTIENRTQALKEINRVLKPKGYLIFTTHNRNDKKYLSFWKKEKQKWDKGIQDDRLFEFGDIIINKTNSEIFIHSPTYEEIVSCILKSNFELVECKLRSEICKESIEVENFSDDCIFWIIRKNK